MLCGVTLLPHQMHYAVYSHCYGLWQGDHSAVSLCSHPGCKAGARAWLQWTVKVSLQGLACQVFAGCTMSCFGGPLLQSAGL